MSAGLPRRCDNPVCGAVFFAENPRRAYCRRACAKYVQHRRPDAMAKQAAWQRWFRQTDLGKQRDRERHARDRERRATDPAFREAERVRRKRRRTSVRGRTCRSCGRTDAQMAWSERRDMCASCETTGGRVGWCPACGAAMHNTGRGRHAGPPACRRCPTPTAVGG